MMSPGTYKKAHHYCNPSIDSNFNPNSVSELNPYDHYGRRLSRHGEENRSFLSANENNKSITPEYIGERNRNEGYHIEKIASPITEVKSCNRNQNLSSVTEEAIDAFEQSEVEGTNRQRMVRGLNYGEAIEEETEFEEEEEEFESESDASGSYVSNSEFTSQNTQRQMEHPQEVHWRPEREYSEEDGTEESIDPELGNERFADWARMLYLPNNVHSYQQLARKGIHPSYKYLYEKYPLGNKQLYEKYIHILS